MINRPNLFATALCVLFFTSLCPIQAQLFNKTKDLPSFQNGKEEKRGLKILSNFNRNKSAPADPIVVSTTTSGTDETLNLKPTTIEQPKKERKFKLPTVKVPTPFKKDPLPIGEAETMVNKDGVLVPVGEEPQEDVVFTSNTISTASKQPPRKEDGSIIYNDWNDVKCYRTSAAQQIVGQLKQQEATHKRKQAAAQKAIEAEMAQAEAQMRQAEAEHRRRALLQGGGGGGIPRGL